MNIFFAKQQTSQSEESFFRKSPDLIVVFTGDSGRIPTALKAIAKFPSSKLMISGVSTKNNLNTLLSAFSKVSPIQRSDILSNFIEIDYKPLNTLQNVDMTMEYLRDNPQMRNVLVISSDYHLFRIFLIEQTFRQDSDQFNFHYSGVQSDYLSPRFFWMSLKEFLKTPLILKALITD